VNFLAHLDLSGRNPEILVGNLMGDFVKGRLEGRYSAGIGAGLELHRRIDRFAEGNPHFINSRHRIDGRFGLFRGALVDLFYDHYLARNWLRYHSEPLPSFILACQTTVSAHKAVLPPPLAQRLPELFESWLPSYCEMEGIDMVLERMSRRFKRQNPLAEGCGELQRNYRTLEEDFFRFYPELQGYVADLLQTSGG
jgi:acyl carrier protein phosphodiesterase